MIDSEAQHVDAQAPALVAEMQDSLLTAAKDLQRLQGLLDDSQQSLQQGFFGTLDLLQAMHAAGRLDADALLEARQQLACAVKALQLQDMASQLIAHTQGRLHRGAEQFGYEDRERVGMAPPAVPQRPNPVTQSAMDTGRIDLF